MVVNAVFISRQQDLISFPLRYRRAWFVVNLKLARAAEEHMKLEIDVKALVKYYAACVASLSKGLDGNTAALAATISRLRASRLNTEAGEEGPEEEAPAAAAEAAAEAAAAATEAEAAAAQQAPPPDDVADAGSIAPPPQQAPPAAARRQVVIALTPALGAPGGVAARQAAVVAAAAASTEAAAEVDADASAEAAAPAPLPAPSSSASGGERGSYATRLDAETQTDIVFFWLSAGPAELAHAGLPEEAELKVAFGSRDPARVKEARAAKILMGKIMEVRHRRDMAERMQKEAMRTLRKAGIGGSIVSIPSSAASAAASVPEEQLPSSPAPAADASEPPGDALASAEIDFSNVEGVAHVGVDETIDDEDEDDNDDDD